MLVRIGGLMQLHFSVGHSLPIMGPSRHSLRVAERNFVDTLASKTLARTLITPQGCSNISRAKLRHLGFLVKPKTVSEVEESSCTSEDEPATEEFNLREQQALKLDGIKRQLNFSPPKATTMNDLPWDRGNGGIVRARKTRTKVKLERDDDFVEKSRSRRKSSNAEVSIVKMEKTEQGEEECNLNVNGMVKQERQEEETLVSPSQQCTEIDDIVKSEPREEAAQRRRSVQSNVLTKMRNVKTEQDQEEKDSEEDQRKVFSRRKRKTLEQGSAGATSAKQASGRNQSMQGINGTALGLEVVSLRPGRRAPLASGTASAIIALPGPFPSYARPFSEECQQAKDLLSALHGHLPEFERHKVSCPTVEQHTEQSLQSLDPSGLVTKTLRRRHTIKSGLQEVDKAVNMQLALTPIATSEHGSRPKDLVSTGRPKDRRAVLDSLIGTLLSQNTTDINSRRAFASLKRLFPTWEEVLRADPKDVEDAIRCGGLAEIKAERIRTILDTLVKERGEVSMEYIRSMSNEDIKVELSRFKGVGPKTVACVLMFHLQREEFPVDTHVFRISKMLGWVPEQADREKAYLHLNQRIPDSLKFDIHCLFVTHGKRCPKCAKRFNRVPSDGECPLLNWKLKWSSERHSLQELEFPSAESENEMVPD